MPKDVLIGLHRPLQQIQNKENMQHCLETQIAKLTKQCDEEKAQNARHIRGAAVV